MLQKVSRCLPVVLVVIACCSVPSIGHTDAWRQTDFPFAAAESLHGPESRLVRFSVHAGKYRTTVEQAGTNSVSRALALIPSLLVTAQDSDFQPYVGAGIGLSIADMAPDVLLAPLQLEESVVLQVGGGVAYHLGHGWALTSGAHFTQFKTTDMFNRIISSGESLTPEGLDFGIYTLEFGLRVSY